MRQTQNIRKYVTITVMDKEGKHIQDQGKIIERINNFCSELIVVKLCQPGRRWTWRSPDGRTKNEIDYIMTDKPSMVTDVTVVNSINIGNDHRMVMGSVTLNTR